VPPPGSQESKNLVPKLPIPKKWSGAACLTYDVFDFHAKNGSNNYNLIFRSLKKTIPKKKHIIFPAKQPNFQKKTYTKYKIFTSALL
jgi:hypothetical protein